MTEGRLMHPLNREREDFEVSEWDIMRRSFLTGDDRQRFSRRRKKVILPVGAQWRHKKDVWRWFSFLYSTMSPFFCCRRKILFASFSFSLPPLCRDWKCHFPSHFTCSKKWAGGNRTLLLLRRSHTGEKEVPFQVSLFFTLYKMISSKRVKKDFFTVANLHCVDFKYALSSLREAYSQPRT